MKKIMLSVAMLALVQFGASAHGKTCHCKCTSAHHATAYHKRMKTNSKHDVGLVRQNKWFGNNTVRAYTGYMPDYLDIYGYRPVQPPYCLPFIGYSNNKVNKAYVAPESPNRDHYSGIAPQSPNHDDYRNVYNYGVQ